MLSAALRHFVPQTFNKYNRYMYIYILKLILRPMTVLGVECLSQDDIQIILSGSKFNNIYMCIYRYYIAFCVFGCMDALLLRKIPMDINV